MERGSKKITLAAQLAAKARRENMQHLQAIESNPLDAEQVAMFELFERESWSHERRRKYILDRARKAAEPEAAE